MPYGSKWKPFKNRCKSRRSSQNRDRHGAGGSSPDPDAPGFRLFGVSTFLSFYVSPLAPTPNLEIKFFACVTARVVQ